MTFIELKLLKIASIAMIMLSFGTAHAFTPDAYTKCEEQAACDNVCMVEGNSRAQIRKCDESCDNKCDAAKPDESAGQ